MGKRWIFILGFEWGLEGKIGGRVDEGWLYIFEVGIFELGEVFLLRWVFGVRVLALDDIELF